ncbi:hypothetical protein Rhopal_005750-T1 [Rhodotorula paludigena]|uniref:DASH complex subunit DAM1 n=1 Tax=Rhodotorula paludigena TaxID=86838 RepID=A0AAV5GT93_9BASI|nr:hypothetical protein Rhopal_005750-T1 [Rhodotorula paludigena]
MQSSQSRSRASSLSRSQRPTTPLRRVSAASLRALSLSHSASRTPSSAEPPLAHLAPVFAELADAVSDLTANCEHVDRVHSRLERTNDAFAAWLLGLRANGYTVDFLEAPTKLNFDLAHESYLERQHALAEQQQQQQQAAFLAAQQQQHHLGAGDDTLLAASSPPRSPSHGETTFVTNDEESFIAPSGAGARARGRGGSATGIARGRGGASVSARGGKVGGLTKRRKDEMAAFADPIMPLLPIALRENRRPECERVLWALRERPSGVVMADLTAALGSSGPTSVPQVRINEILLALVRAKIAIKQLSKGVTTYRLDPNKYPS